MIRWKQTAEAENLPMKELKRRFGTVEVLGASLLKEE